MYFLSLYDTEYSSVSPGQDLLTCTIVKWRQSCRTRTFHFPVCSLACPYFRPVWWSCRLPWQWWLPVVTHSTDTVTHCFGAVHRARQEWIKVCNPTPLLSGDLFLLCCVCQLCALLMHSAAEIDWKSCYGLLSQATSTSPLSSQPLVKETQALDSVQSAVPEGISSRELLERFPIYTYTETVNALFLYLHM